MSLWVILCVCFFDIFDTFTAPRACGTWGGRVGL